MVPGLLWCLCLCGLLLQVAPYWVLPHSVLVIGFLGGVRERGVVWFSALIILVIGILTGAFADLEGRDLSEIGIHYGQ
ncbi:MAG: hypothetical protein Ct9H300mP15_09560 [Gemmatimonadota bacterium]|nr:MAG: hypothetical protein Ct9H300mP15_09560 [Gemmatimonadota bacterium]